MRWKPSIVTGNNVSALHLDSRAGRSFRPDIEGLRAVAVISVVLYHLKFSWIPGGFVGVDVFFVISGYLMAEIILDDISQDKFSTWGFFERRLRRIWPALMFVMLVSLLFGMYALLPDQLSELAKSVLSSFFLANNVMFWMHTGYFTPAAENNVLLHLWSIAVEQQFYLSMPLLMLGAFPGDAVRWRRLVVVAALGSLLLCVILTSARPVASFYLLPTRIWEFLLGSMIAIYRCMPVNRTNGEISSAVGLGLILGSALWLNGRTAFPGYWALCPCGGAALVIFGNTGIPTFVGRVLSSTPLVAVGAISYSLYLWHWPILTFVRLSGAALNALPVQISIIAAALVCSYFTWRYIEIPFRKSAPSTLTLRRSALIMFAVVLATTGAAAVATDGLPSRLDAETAKILAFEHYPRKAALYREGECFLRLDQPAAEFSADRCSDGMPGKINLLLWGDSHAAHYAYGLREAGKKFDIGFLQSTYAGCAPIPFRVSNSSSCREFGAKISALAMKPEFDAIVLSANWTGYPGILPELSQITHDFTRAGKLVILIGPSVEFNRSLPVMLAGLQPGIAAFNEPMAKWLSRAAIDLDHQMRVVFAGLPGVLYVSPISEACTNDVCPIVVGNGVPLTWDSTHLTAEGSLLVSSLLLKIIGPAIRERVFRADASNL